MRVWYKCVLLDKIHSISHHCRNVLSARITSASKALYASYSCGSDYVLFVGFLCRLLPKILAQLINIFWASKKEFESLLSSIFSYNVKRIQSE